MSKDTSFGCVVLLALMLAACDTVEPVESGRLVVEAFVTAGEALPAVTVRSTQPLGASDPGGSPVEDAEVVLAVGGRAVPYEAVEGEPGRYRPVAADASDRIAERAPFALAVEWETEAASAGGHVPPRIAIDSVRLRVPPKPVEAVVLDSLRLDTLGTGARQGFIYPIDVDVYWTTDFAEVGADSSYWMRPHLQPSTTSPSAIEEFFVRQDQVLRERAVEQDTRGVRKWTGIYAVPVGAATDPLPEHSLRVALLRSEEDYARYALTRDDPDRREPFSNVEGGLGIVAGVAIDSLTLMVR